MSTVCDDTFFWNFQVGPEGGRLLVKDVVQMFPRHALDEKQELAYGLNGCNVQVEDVSLSIPPGALENEITVTLGISWGKSDVSTMSRDQVLVGPVVHCLPNDLHFNRPVKLSFHCRHEAVQLEVWST